MSKHMLTAGKMKGMISKKTRAIELIQEAAEHLKDARKFLIDFSKIDPKEYFEITAERLDEINENLIDMIGGLNESGKENNDEDTDEDGEDENEDEEEENDDDEEGEENEEE